MRRLTKKYFFICAYVLCVAVILAATPRFAFATSIEIREDPMLQLEVADASMRDLMEDLLPGMERTTTLTFQNNTSSSVLLSLDVHSKEAKKVSLLEKITLELEAENTTVFVGPFEDACTQQSIDIGEISPRTTLALSVHMVADPSADNAYALDNNMVFWNFVATRSTEAKDDPEVAEAPKRFLAQTGVSLIPVAISIAVLLITTFVIRKRGGKHAQK